MFWCCQDDVCMLDGGKGVQPCVEKEVFFSAPRQRCFSLLPSAQLATVYLFGLFVYLLYLIGLRNGHKRIELLLINF